MAATPQEIPARSTLAQVAERAGVSLKTASRALGGEAYVSEETRGRVLAAAADLGYQRNSAASLLASGRLAVSIGLITGDFANPFYSTLAAAVEDEVRPRTIHLSVANSRESAEQEWLLAQDLADRQAQALIVVSALQDHAAYSRLQSRGIAVVFADRTAMNLDADSVVFDNREGGRLAAQHLLDAGHSRIALIGDYEWLPTYRERKAGMAEVLDAAGVQWRDLIRNDAHGALEARQFVRELLELEDPPTAVVAGNNRSLLGLTQELAARKGHAAPAVIGFDDPEWAQVLGITVVAGDVAEMGRAAARLALLRMSERSRPIENVVIPMRLIRRD
ncbi:LacI family DNA-binding transcriptional regulator [uncultured Agrococcus sp.]|uniref:LacI family DNA-binding transcriptional regulator n=1 Tax=uncultured Agrococcus sp. TaxID=382258 RepID=UPI0025E23FA0|nr:LacI family DNA-binding transcriptional regulator [uncultured Agrococcus sp.]